MKTKTLLLATIATSFSLGMIAQNAHSQRFEPQIYSEGFNRIEHNHETQENNLKKSEKEDVKSIKSKENKNTKKS